MTIQTTKNYSVFTTTFLHRPMRPGKITSLAACMKEHGYIKAFPAIVRQAPPEGMDEVNRTIDDWTADVEAAETPMLAALTVIDWLEAKVEDQANARAFREYMSEGPDKAAYNSSPTAPT